MTLTFADVGDDGGFPEPRQQVKVRSLASETFCSKALVAGAGVRRPFRAEPELLVISGGYEEGRTWTKEENAVVAVRNRVGTPPRVMELSTSARAGAPSAAAVKR